MWHPESPASYESLPAPLATQIPTLWIHTSRGGGAGGCSEDRCRAFDLFASVDAHLWVEGTTSGTPKATRTLAWQGRHSTATACNSGDASNNRHASNGRDAIISTNFHRKGIERTNKNIQQRQQKIGHLYFDSFFVPPCSPSTPSLFWHLSHLLPYSDSHDFLSILYSM
jgi:hypothetical protein